MGELGSSETGSRYGGEGCMADDGMGAWVGREGVSVCLVHVGRRETAIPRVLNTFPVADVMWMSALLLE